MWAPKTTLQYFKAATPAGKKLSDGDANSVVYDFCMSPWRIVESQDAHRPHDFHAGRVRGDDHDALLNVPVGVRWIGLPDHKMDTTSDI